MPDGHSQGNMRLIKKSLNIIKSSSPKEHMSACGHMLDFTPDAL